MSCFIWITTDRPWRHQFVRMLTGLTFLGHNVLLHKVVSFLSEWAQVLDNNPSFATALCVTTSSTSGRGLTLTHSHGGARLWWSNLTCVPVSYTAWHDPLISRFKGPHLPSVPRLRFRGAPTVPHCTLRGPPSRDAEEQKVTFQLSVSLNSNSSQLRVRFILRQLGSKWGTTLPTLTTKRGGESLGCLFTLFTLWGVSLKSAASGFERLTVYLSAHALTPSAHSLVSIGSVCRGEMRMGIKMFKINQVFSPPLFPTTLFQGALIRDRDVRA